MQQCSVPDTGHRSLLAGGPDWYDPAEGCRPFMGRKPTIFQGVSGLLMTMFNLAYVYQIQRCLPINALPLGFAPLLKVRHISKIF